jgi:hypothetical protein
MPKEIKGAETMKQVNIKDGVSADIVQENAEHLKTLFPPRHLPKMALILIHSASYWVI